MHSPWMQGQWPWLTKRKFFGGLILKNLFESSACRCPKTQLSLEVFCASSLLLYLDFLGYEFIRPASRKSAQDLIVAFVQCFLPWLNF